MDPPRVVVISTRVLYAVPVESSNYAGIRGWCCCPPPRRVMLWQGARPGISAMPRPIPPGVRALCNDSRTVETSPQDSSAAIERSAIGPTSSRASTPARRCAPPSVATRRWAFGEIDVGALSCRRRPSGSPACCHPAKRHDWFAMMDGDRRFPPGERRSIRPRHAAWSAVTASGPRQISAVMEGWLVILRQAGDRAEPGDLRGYCLCCVRPAGRDVG